MKVETRMMGTVDVKEEEIIHIPRGLFGFESYIDFAVLPSEYEPFMWMQSMQDKNLAFLIVDPFLICPEFEADIDDKELSKIGISDPADVMVMSIVTVPRDGGPVTANLQGPLVINRRNRLCMQAVLNDAKWTTKHNIIEALKKKEGR